MLSAEIKPAMVEALTIVDKTFVAHNLSKSDYDIIESKWSNRT